MDVGSPLSFGHLLLESNKSGDKSLRPVFFSDQNQKMSAFRVRVLYVNKAVYANYRDFLNTRYERYYGKLEKKDWMNEL